MALAMVRAQTVLALAVRWVQEAVVIFCAVVEGAVAAEEMAAGMAAGMAAA